MQEIQLITWLQEIVKAVKDWEISPIIAYKKFKDFDKMLKDSYEAIQSEVKDELYKYPWEYKEFTLTTRKTLNYKENQEYMKKQTELKDLEKIIKIATDMNEKGASYVDEDWVVIDPVSYNLSEVLIYKAKW